MKDERDNQTVDFLQNDSDAALKRAGRPRKYTDAAAKQAAYRARMKEQGKRVVSRVIKDVRSNELARSTIIDLSACRLW